MWVKSEVQHIEPGAMAKAMCYKYRLRCVKYVGAALDNRDAITIAFTFHLSEIRASTDPDEWPNKSLRCPD